jgi:hypothetical protein
MYPRLSSPAVLYPSFPISRRSLSIELPTCSIRRLSMGGLRNADASTKKGGKGCDDVLDTETGKTRASVASRRVFRERLGGFGQEVRTVIKPATFVVACDDGRWQSPSYCGDHCVNSTPCSSANTNANCRKHAKARAGSILICFLCQTDTDRPWLGVPRGKGCDVLTWPACKKSSG